MLCLLVLVACLASSHAQFDLLLQGGQVFDARNSIPGTVLDVAIANGVVAAVAPDINPALADTVINVSGLVVTPGLIDVHAHVFFGNNPPFSIFGQNLVGTNQCVMPDEFCPQTGVTTVVDAGSSGHRDYDQFVNDIVVPSQTRVLAWLNICGAGIAGNIGPNSPQQNLTDFVPIDTAIKIVQNRDSVIGIKLTHYAGPEYDPMLRAIEASELAGDVPVIVDWKNLPLPLQMETLLTEIFRPGDVLTHTYGRSGTGGPALVDVNTNILKPYARVARERGVLFDSADGGGEANFAFSQAIPGIAQDFLADTIATDMTSGGLASPVVIDLNNMMGKLMAVGMTLEQAIDRVTWRSAQMIGRPELGHLSVGAIADIAVLNAEIGAFPFLDGTGTQVIGDTRITTELTVKDGAILFDRKRGVQRKQ